jgi:1-deoxy-D-xylulose-5-phosphate synthase
MSDPSNNANNSKANDNSKTPLLNQVNTPQDLKKFSLQEIKQLAQELRFEVIDKVSKTGGHLGAGLGVVELTTALHYVFNTPVDKLIWDVGHQAYPHKILTGRRDKMLSIRQPQGLSGFTKRSESEYDPFGAGHSSTSISSALGIAVGKKFKNEKSHVIAVIGDGAMSAGMAYEALNNAGALEDQFFHDNRLIVILNDNDMSIAPPTGAMSHYFSRLVASKSYLKIRDFSKKIVDKLPNSIGRFPRKFEKATKEWWMGGNIFEELGFYYIGPIDGHNLDVLIPILENIRDDKASDPILIHCITQKGKGLNEEMPSADKLHAVSKFDLDTKIQQTSATNKLSLSKIFGKKLAMLANTDDKILAITAAMPTGTGLDQFMQIHPTKTFDVGIAEQHAVTFSAGLACEGLKPYCAIYSTFLQRAYDQVVHDVAIQKLPVRFIIDRAGFVGADGPTHAGSFDIAFLINLPHFILMAPSDAQELIKMLNTINNINNQPSAIRFPRQDYDQNLDFADSEILEIGKGRIIQEANQDNEIKIAILAYGTILQNAIKASEILQQKFDLKITIADARFAKPFDEDLVIQLTKTHSHLIIIEEGAVGGFGSIVAQFLINHNLLATHNCQLKLMNCSDKFIEQNKIEAMQEESGIGVNSIVEVVKGMVGR